MQPAITLNDFVKKNHKDVVRIASSLLKRNDQGLLDDIVQQFYVNVLKYDVLGKFDWSVPNSSAAFAMWIKSTIKNVVRSEYTLQSRKFGLGRNDVELKDPNTAETSSIYGHIVPVNFTYGNRSNTGDVRIHPSYCGSHVVDDTSHMDLLEALGKFKDHVRIQENASDRTKDLLLSYLALSEEGLKPSEIAAEFDVTPTYITTIRKRLSSMFKDYQEYGALTE